MLENTEGNAARVHSGIAILQLRVRRGPQTPDDMLGLVVQGRDASTPAI
jgi:hypothetical protein